MNSTHQSPSRHLEGIIHKQVNGTNRHAPCGGQQSVKHPHSSWPAPCRDTAWENLEVCLCNPHTLPHGNTFLSTDRSRLFRVISTKCPFIPSLTAFDVVVKQRPRGDVILGVADAVTSQHCLAVMDLSKPTGEEAIIGDIEYNLHTQVLDDLQLSLYVQIRHCAIQPEYHSEELESKLISLLATRVASGLRDQLHKVSVSEESGPIELSLHWWPGAASSSENPLLEVAETISRSLLASFLSNPIVAPANAQRPVVWVRTTYVMDRAQMQRETASV